MSEEKPKDEQSGDKNDTTTPVPPEFARFVGLLNKILSVSKEELDERKAEYERKKKRG